MVKNNMDWVLRDDIYSSGHDNEEGKQVEQSHDYEVLVSHQSPFVHFRYAVYDPCEVYDTKHDDEHLDCH